MPRRAAPPTRPIGDHALLSDCHSAALVDRTGSVTWLCLPRFDSPSVFARILDPGAGHWSITPDGPYEVERRYLDRSLVLETRFTTTTGIAVLTDALLVGEGERDHGLGEGSPHVLARTVAVVDGTVTLAGELAARPEYGLVRPRAEVLDRTVELRGGAEVLVVSGPPPSEVDGGDVRWRLELDAGEQAAFALCRTSRAEPAAAPWTEDQIRARVEDTAEAWRSWSALHQTYEGPARDLVLHSGRVLQGLTHQPTGAIVAAPTTSLPEEVGGTRNWDYRYAWVRDTSFTLNALWVAACPDEADHVVQFLVDTAGATDTDDFGLQIMYGVGGEHDLTERELPQLAGWRDSSPVRVGNGAWDQRQHDIFGEILDAVLLLQDTFEPTPATCRFLVELADEAAAAWREPDAGIWELRDEPRHHLYSKVMCWVALDRASRLAGWLGVPERAEGWAEEAEVIRAEVLDRGWNEDVGSFTQTLDGHRLDASALVLAIVGFLPVDDPRMSATIDRIGEDLATTGGLLYRYAADDGIDGDEGPFLICTFWLVECLAARGDHDRATELFEQVVGHVNDVGLLAEQLDPDTGEQLGNFPQALSHAGLVNAAWALSGRGDPFRAT